ncbi:MAG: hypothetical protein IPK26_02215 [Planctomycetes bacterium]|nr:hypothetical protein [Planctomycetota bacterium]
MFTLRNAFLSLTACTLAATASAQTTRWLSSPFQEFLFAASSSQAFGGSALGGTTSSSVEIEHDTWAVGATPLWRPVLRAAQSRRVHVRGTPGQEAVRIDGTAYPSVTSATCTGRVLINGIVRQTATRIGTAPTFGSALHIADGPAFQTTHWIGASAVTIRNAFTASATFQYAAARIQPGIVNDNDMTFAFGGQTGVSCTATIVSGTGFSLTATLSPGSSSASANFAVAENALVTDYDATMTAIQGSNHMRENLTHRSGFLQIIDTQSSSSTVQRVIDEQLGRPWMIPQ